MLFWENKIRFNFIKRNFVKSAAHLNIDSYYISEVEVETGADNEALKDLYLPFAVVNIKLKI